MQNALRIVGQNEIGQMNNCRATTFEWKLMTLRADTYANCSWAAVCGCQAGPGLPAACTFSSSMINCFDNFGLCRHCIQIPCQMRRAIRGKHAVTPPLPAPIPLCRFPAAQAVLFLWQR